MEFFKCKILLGVLNVAHFGELFILILNGNKVYVDSRLIFLSLEENKVCFFIAFPDIIQNPMPSNNRNILQL